MFRREVADCARVRVCSRSQSGLLLGAGMGIFSQLVGFLQTPLREFQLCPELFNLKKKLSICLGLHGFPRGIRLAGKAMRLSAAVQG